MNLSFSETDERLQNAVANSLDIISVFIVHNPDNIANMPSLLIFALIHKFSHRLAVVAVH